MTIRIIHGNALDLPLGDASVDLVVTSPPYFGLRSYQDGGEHYAGQIGSEATPAEFVDALIAATREMVRVLKPSGSIWVNLGDKYAGSGGGGEGSSDGQTGRASRPPRRDVGIPTKSLMGIPWRYAIRCIDELGLILRAEVIWSKPNGLPESVTDRVRRSHETWFHFTRQPRYFSAVDEIREAHDHGGHGSTKAERLSAGQQVRGLMHNGAMGRDNRMEGNPLGKLPGSVWTVPTEPLRVPDHLGIDHFAAFPTEWPRRIIQGWSPSGVCVECGEGRRPVASTVRTFDGEPIGPGQGGIFGDVKRQSRNQGVGNWRFAAETAITGYACACPEPTAPTTPGVVLDPFGGTGTTALVADVLGRDAISVDLSADYCSLAQWRTTDPNERARAARVEAPPAVLDGQLSLFDEEMSL